MIRSKNGQALIEFIIILPVFILLLFAFIDFGKIVYVKNELSNTLPIVKSMYEEGKTYEEILLVVEKNNKENRLNIKNENKFITFEIYRNVELVTPGLGIVLDNPYKVDSSLVVEYEE